MSSQGTTVANNVEAPATFNSTATDVAGLLGMSETSQSLMKQRQTLLDR
jgi:hypothetical protein